MLQQTLEACSHPKQLPLALTRILVNALAVSYLDYFDLP